MRGGIQEGTILTLMSGGIEARSDEIAGGFMIIPHH